VIPERYAPSHAKPDKQTRQSIDISNKVPGSLNIINALNKALRALKRSALIKYSPLKKLSAGFLLKWKAIP